MTYAEYRKRTIDSLMFIMSASRKEAAKLVAGYVNGITLQTWMNNNVSPFAAAQNIRTRIFITA